MNNVIILGNFDGVHLGHQELIKKAIEFGKINNMKVIVYTFKTLPSNKEHIMTIEQKINKIKQLGVDEIILDDFYLIKNYKPEEFVKEILIAKLNAKKIFCGYNYTFGKDRLGDAQLMKKYIDTTVIDEFKINNMSVSSSNIRKLIKQGNIKLANTLLNDAYCLEGYVIHGKKLGRTIGFPTANIRPNATKIIPPLGAYGVKLKIDDDDKIYLGIMNIGKNPTVNNDNCISIETNILDFNRDIYGKKIRIKIYELLRFERKFESLNHLKEQIKKDELNWRNINDKY